MTESSFNAQYAYFEKNYAIIKDKIAYAARKAGRNPKEITLLAATKTVAPDFIAYAASKGITAIGENRVQEMLGKYDQYPSELKHLAFIGQLQTNKVKYIADKVDCIQSVDSEKLATVISNACVKIGRRMPVLVEVNIGNEMSKGGVRPDDLLGFIEKISQLQGIAVSGLMSIPPATAEVSERQRYFSALQEHYVDIMKEKIDNVNMVCLSMGMSDDYEQAIACGSTMVRIGSALFGRRTYNA